MDDEFTVPIVFFVSAYLGIDKQNNQINMKTLVNFISIIVAILSGVLVLKTCSWIEKSGSPSSHIESKTISSTEDATNYLNGKTFIATPSGWVWYKLTFSGNTYTLWHGVPQHKGWNIEGSGSYTIKQGRYTDSGQSYFYAKFETSSGSLDCRMFDIQRTALYSCMNGNDPLAIMQQGDRDPWN